MNWIARLDVFVLAIMLAYVVLIITRVSYCYHLDRRARAIDSSSRRRLAAILSNGAGTIKSIASTAPYLGLLGTCVGIVSASEFSGSIAMEHDAFLAMMAAKLASALVTTLAGILVAVPATCSYNYLCGRMDLLGRELSNRAFTQTSRHGQVIRRLALTKRFSQLPAFAVIAAPVLAILVAAYTPFFPPRKPTGFGVDLASTRCGYDGDDRLIVLRVTDAGRLFLNSEQEDWNSLPNRLSEIYSMRVDHTLYVVADDGVPFQTLADALDTVENAPVTVGRQAVGMGMDKLDITVRLVTPRALNARCAEPVMTGSGKHALR